MTCCYCGRQTRLEARLDGELRPICFRPCMHILWAEQAGMRSEAPRTLQYIERPVTVQPGWDVITERLAAWTERQAETARLAQHARRVWSPHPASVRLDGERVQAARIARGWLREGLAQFAGCSATTVHTVERGLPVSKHLARDIAQALRVPLDDLLPGAAATSRGVAS